MNKNLNQNERNLLNKMNYRSNLIINLESLLQKRGINVNEIQLNNYCNKELEFLLIKETHFNLIYNQTNLN